MVVLSDRERAALDDFCARVRRSFGERVSRLALFGSRARGDVHDASDIDVCVAIDGLTWREKHEVYALNAAVLEEHDVVLSAYVVSTEHLDHLRRRERTIATDIARDGIALSPPHEDVGPR